MPVPAGPLPLLRCRARDVLQTAEGDELATSQPDSYCCRFCPRPGAQHVLASADEDGTIKLWDTRPSAQQRLIHYESAHTNAIYELDWSQDGRHLLSAAGDRAIKLWDADRLTPLAEFRRHSRTVKTVTFLPEDPCVFASGGRDGVIEVWDVRVTKQISHEIRPRRRDAGARGTPRRGDTAETITSLVFRDDRYLLSAASGSSGVSVWDLRKLYSSGRQPPPVYRLEGAEPGRGVVCMTADRRRAQLYVSRINDVIQRYSLTNWTADPVGTFSGHQCGSFYVRCAVSPDGGRLASGSSDRAARLWSAEVGGAPAARLPGHLDEVTCVAWSADSATLATLSDDLHLRLWRSDLLPRELDEDDPLLMERLARPAGADSAAPRPSPLPLLTLCRETGTRWRPGRARGTSGPPQLPSAAAPARQGQRQTRRTSAAAGSSAFLAGWLRGRAGGGSGSTTPTRSSPRKRDASGAGETEAVSTTPTRSSPRKRDASGAGDAEAVSPSKRVSPLLTLSPSRMCFTPVSPTKSGSLTPVQSPFKRHSVYLSPSGASTSTAGATTPTGAPSRTAESRGLDSRTAGSPRRAVVATPTASPSRRRHATPPGKSPRRSLLGDMNGERVSSPAPAPTRTSPRKTANTPSGADPSTPSGASRTGSSLAGSPHTPVRSSPRKTSAKVLFSCSPAVRGACLTPETRRLRPADQYRSPTADLPNWVVDGVSPHRPVAARPRRQPQTDWLTTLSQRKRAQASPAATPPAAKRTRRPARGRRQTPG